MSGIRVNEWLHNSGTGGIWQTSAGNVGIASSVPTAKLVVTGDANISCVTTANQFSGAAFIPSAGQLSNRNLVINGAMQVAQRGDTTGVQDGYGGGGGCAAARQGHHLGSHHQLEPDEGTHVCRSDAWGDWR